MLQHKTNFIFNKYDGGRHPNRGRGHSYGPRWWMKIIKLCKVSTATWGRTLRTRMPAGTVPWHTVPLAVPALARSNAIHCEGLPHFATAVGRFCSGSAWCGCPRRMTHCMKTIRRPWQSCGNRFVGSYLNLCLIYNMKVYCFGRWNYHIIRYFVII